MTKEKIDPTREEKLAVLWAALKTLPDEYVLRTAMPDGVPVTRRFIGYDLPRCIELLERSLIKWPNNMLDMAILARLREKLEAGR